MVEVGKEFLKDKDDFSSRTDASINTSSTSVIRLVKQNQLSFFGIEIIKSLPTPVHSLIDWIQKFKSQF